MGSLDPRQQHAHTGRVDADPAPLAPGAVLDEGLHKRLLGLAAAVPLAFVHAAAAAGRRAPMRVLAAPRLVEVLLDRAGLRADLRHDADRVLMDVHGRVAFHPIALLVAHGQLASTPQRRQAAPATQLPRGVRVRPTEKNVMVRASAVRLVLPVPVPQLSAPVLARLNPLA